MTPIVAFAHCVCGIKLPLLSSQLPASNAARLLCGDLPPPVLPFSQSFSLSVSLTLSSQLFSPVLSVCLTPSYLFLELPLFSSHLKKKKTCSLELKVYRTGDGGGGSDRVFFFWGGGGVKR